MSRILIKEGEIIADGTEQLAIEYTETGRLDGIIDLSHMAVGDTVLMREYQKINGSYELYAEEPYYGVQVMPSIDVIPKTGKDGIRFTIQQTAGVFKSYHYMFFVEVEKGNILPI